MAIAYYTIPRAGSLAGNVFKSKGCPLLKAERGAQRREIVLVHLRVGRRRSQEGQCVEMVVVLGDIERDRIGRAPLRDSSLFLLPAGTGKSSRWHRFRSRYPQLRGFPRKILAELTSCRGHRESNLPGRSAIGKREGVMSLINADRPVLRIAQRDAKRAILVCLHWSGDGRSARKLVIEHKTPSATCHKQQDQYKHHPAAYVFPRSVGLRQRGIDGGKIGPWGSRQGRHRRERRGSSGKRLRYLRRLNALPSRSGHGIARQRGRIARWRGHRGRVERWPRLRRRVGTPPGRCRRSANVLS